MNSKKLQQINEVNGLEVLIHGGSDRVVVLWNIEDQEYWIGYFKANEQMPPYATDSASAETLEGKMRELCADLRKWRKSSMDTDQ